MLALIQCESGGNAQAIGAEWYEGRLITFGGWFQDTNGTGDPATDTARAYQKWLAWQRGEVPDPWPNC